MPVQSQIQSLQYSQIFLVKLISVHSADSKKNITWKITSDRQHEIFGGAEHNVNYTKYLTSILND